MQGRPTTLATRSSLRECGAANGLRRALPYNGTLKEPIPHSRIWLAEATALQVFNSNSGQQQLASKVSPSG